MFNLDLRTNRNPAWNTQLDKEFDKFFDVFSKQDYLAPACEILDEERSFSISLDMPGMRKEDIDIEVKDNRLHITGERKSENRTDKENVLRSERRYGKFSRVFGLPQNVNSEAIEARFEDGVLEVILPKEEKSQTKKITINGSKREDQVQLSQ